MRVKPHCNVVPIVKESTRGNWNASDCLSKRRNGTFSDYYTFTVEGESPRTVQIDLISATDAYLFLIEGNTSEGTTSSPTMTTG